MKKQVFKKALSLVIAVFLAVGSVFVMPATEVSAAAAPKKITLNAKNKTIGVGQTFKLKVKSATPKKASKKVTFKSSNKKVAKVTSSGSVKGIKAGTAKITVTSKAKKTVKATCKVTVAAINVSNAKNGVLSVQVNKSVTVKPSMQPKSVKVGGYTYSIQDKGTATVASNGNVTGVKAGKTTLTIKSKKKKKTDPVFTLKLTVNVSEPSGGSQPPGNEKPGGEEPGGEEPGDEEPDVDDPAAIKRWKFDFGSATDVAEGYTAVTADKDYWAEDNTDGYGFMGINKESDLVGNRFDSFGNQLGQVQVLQTGGGKGLKDAIGCVGITAQKDELGDEYYPTRFALKVPDDTYYKVTATVTTLDPTKDATATLYTERKHPIYTDKTIQAGKTVKSVFTIRVTPIYYEKSDPKGLISDEMVNVCVAGDNTALAALKIEQIETAPTLWVLGDSTVTDGNTTLPFFRLQNYTGVGTGLTQYLPSNVAMVNEGEGGLNALDNSHFNVVQDRIKQGDWLYVEYGHNHKSADGVSEYKGCLDKYYDLCDKVGAKLLIVSPIERINNFSGGVYQHSLDGFARAGEAYVQAKVDAGKTNIAFVDLNKTSYEFYNKITRDNGGDANIIKFYFCTEFGAKATDTTHPNDTGAENLAYCFFEAAKAVTDETQKAVLSGLLDGMSEEQPHLVSKAITDLGPAPNKAWPEYTLPIDEKYPVAIKDIRFDEDGKLSYVKVKVQQAQTTMSDYGIIEVTINNADGSVKGVLYANDQVDNSTGYGVQTITSFRTEGGSDVVRADGDTYSIVVYRAYRDPNNLLVKDDDNFAYSRVVTSENISEIEEYLLPGERGDVEDFNHFSQTTLTGSGKWSFGGSSGSDLSLGKDASGKTYTNLAVTEVKGSWVVAREFENLTDKGINIGTGKTGKYMIDAELNFKSGSNLKFSFAENVTNKAPFIEGAILDAFVIRAGGEVTSHGTKLTAKLTQNQWTHIKYVLNMDAGTAEITIGNSEPQTVNVPEFATYGEVAINTFRYLSITQAENRSSFNAQLSDLTVAKLRNTGAQAEVKASVTGLGKVKINDQEIRTANVPLASQVTLEAVPEGESAFTGWYMGDTLYSTQRKISLRAYQNTNLEARFIVAKETNVIVNYKDTDGNTIKPTETVTEVNGVALFEGQSFTLDDSYLGQIAVTDGALTKLYLYNGQASNALTIASLGAEGSNVINLVFALDGIYDEFEDFSSSELTPANWGFTAGTSGNIAWKNGTLGIFLNGAINKETSDVKALSTKITSAKKLTVRFDWINDVEYNKSRSSSFNLKDLNGKVIFSLFAQGNKGVFYAVNGIAGESSTKVPGDSRDWNRVKLTIDFEAKKISGTIINLTTGTETAIAETALTEATNLATLSADYGYSVAPQRLDNFGIRYKEQ